MEDAHSSGGTRIAITLVLMAFHGGVGYLIGSRKGKGTLGLILGSMLGVIGWIVLAFIPGESVVVVKPRKLCRDCRKQIPKRAAACPYCGGGGALRPGSGTAPRPGTRVGVGRPTRRRL